MTRSKSKNMSGARQWWLAGLGLIVVSCRNGRRWFDRAVSAGRIGAVLAREIVADVRAHLDGLREIAAEAGRTSRRRH